MNLIEKNLYLGDICAAHNENLLKSNSITHVLTIDLHPLPIISRLSNVIYKFVEANDVPDVDILQYFDDCFNYIQEAIENNGVVFVDW